VRGCFTEIGFIPLAIIVPFTKPSAWARFFLFIYRKKTRIAVMGLWKRQPDMYVLFYLTLTSDGFRIVIPAHHEPVCFSSHLHLGILIGFDVICCLYFYI